MVGLKGVAPAPLGASKAAVFAFAEKLAAGFGFFPGAPLDPLVARLGGKIEFKNAVERNSRLPESMIVRSQSDFTIFLPTMTSLARDRFTIAHELGHFFLHYPAVYKEYSSAIMIATRWVDETDPLQQRAEWEANWFAAAFLMPKNYFVEYLRSHGIDEVAEHFAVTVSAANIRAKSLRIDGHTP